MPEGQPQQPDNSHRGSGRSGPPHASPLASKRHNSAGWGVALSAVWPEILDDVPLEDRELAERALTMPLVRCHDEDLATVMGRHIPGAFDFLIVEGVALKQTTLLRHRASELLGPGDLLAPPLTSERQLESRAVSRYVSQGSVSLLAINARFGQTARRWPGVADVLHDRLGRQTHRASMHAAMLHLPRIEDRLIALFADLAERFGRVSTVGILVDLALTHETIGGLVGSRRPTVSLGLRALADQGLLAHGNAGRWVVSRSIVAA